MRVEALASSDIEVNELAIRIMRVSSGGTHAGLLYRFQGELFLLDLRWHENFGVEKVGVGGRATPLYCVIPNFLPEEMNDATTTCELIVDRKFRGLGPQRLPYGFGMPQNAQVTDEGELIWGGGVGLTCSTFVLAVFEAAAIPFVDLSDWVRRPEDDERHRLLLKWMEEGIPKYDVHPAPRDHVEKVRRELPCIRVRPEEVAAAGAATELPAGFDFLSRTGARILEWITDGTAQA
jgi:hypothetical protein